MLKFYKDDDCGLLCNSENIIIKIYPNAELIFINGEMSFDDFYEVISIINQV